MGQPALLKLSKPDYGVDAPGLVKMFIAAGAFALCVAIAINWLLPGWRIVLAPLAALVAGYTFGMGLLMVVWSKVVKLRTRDEILNHFSWKGDERVLDVGCGRGLLLVGAATRLTTGRATGIDVWQAADQSDNRPEATLENARLEGVADRVTVDTGDMRTLPYPDQSFDVVTSHWVVHNVAGENEQSRAISEMHRVLKPGGKMVLADIAQRDFYTQCLTELGFKEVEVVFDPFVDRILRSVSGGSFGPATHFAVR